jgi:large-conductance mechanosensitive channel
MILPFNLFFLIQLREKKKEKKKKKKEEEEKEKVLYIPIA